ncbi:MAG TPA: DUF1579 family protein [Acidimicrobiia bacterium]|nr:DUF1579 family protein [Acidimicrobiia bacterium]
MSDAPCSSPEARQLDFWLGEWDLSWPAQQTGGEPGERLTGRNSITRLFDNCVIEENFTTRDGGYRGHSVSLYDERAAVWRQTWVDSSGSYLWFTGGVVDGVMVFATEPTERDGEIVVNRMVFNDVTPDSLEWAWQRSSDVGRSWTDLWNISYVRRV